MQTDLAVSPAGDVWVMNNWENINSCFGVPPELRSTHVVARELPFSSEWPAVRPPQIGPARALGER